MIEYGQAIVLFVACVTAILVSFFTIPLFIKIAFAREILDRPTSLKNHKAPTPYLGGLAVYSAVLIVLALFFPLHWNLSLFLIGATLLLLVGLVDDLLPLTAAYKFWGQIVAALCFMKGGFLLKQEFLGSFSYPLMPLFLMIISFFWILTIINAFNLVDIMDGLATTCALGALGGFLLFSSFYSLYSVSLLIVICIGTLLGFLYFNKSPAKIYLGDAGSLFVGGILAIIPFMIPWGTYTAFGFFTPVIILGIPLLEVLSLIVIRTYKKIPFYLGSRDHFAHFLLDQHWSKGQILIFISLVNCALITTSFLFNKNYLSLLSTIMILLLLLVAWCATLYRKNMPIFGKNK
jgi:UDP-GlcNAc:undecaprenyl-phosphate GlcNAc-1-phosphate transferase